MKLDINNTPDTIYATLSGRLDTAASSDFSRDMMPMMDDARKHIVLDCSQLEFISSSGLRLLLMLRKQTIAQGGDITIKCVNDAVKQVFTITGFYALFNFE